jgi:phenylacetate-CoA ligase
MMTDEQFNKIKDTIIKVAGKSEFYQKKFEGIDLNEIKSLEDFQNLPYLDTHLQYEMLRY